MSRSVSRLLNFQIFTRGLRSWKKFIHRSLPGSRIFLLKVRKFIYSQAQYQVNFSLDTLPKMIMIHLWHVPSGHIDEGYEGEGDEDVASWENDGANLARTHPGHLIRVNPSQLESIRVNSSQPKSTRVNPNQPELTQINLSPPESKWVNPSRRTESLCCFVSSCIRNTGQPNEINNMLNCFCQTESIKEEDY